MRLTPQPGFGERDFLCLAACPVHRVLGAGLVEAPMGALSLRSPVSHKARLAFPSMCWGTFRLFSSVLTVL